MSSTLKQRTGARIALLLSLSAAPVGAESLARPGEKDEGVVSALSLDRMSKSAQGLRKLGENPRPEAAELLVSFARDSTVTDDPVRRLALIVALYEHCRGPERLPIVVALLSLFEEEDREGGAESASLRKTEARGDMKYRARGATAFALAGARHPLGLRFLIARATQGADLDPIGADLARRALETVPKETWDDEAIAVLQGLPKPPLSSKKMGTDAPAVKNPKELVALVRGEGPGSRGELVQVENWAAELEKLVQSQTIPADFLSANTWRDAYDKDRVTALRSLAYLKAIQSPRILRLTSNFAERSLRSNDPTERQAATFALAVVAPEKAAKLFASNDPVVIKALLGQATEGPLARAAYHWAKEQREKKDPAEVAQLAQENARWEADLWEEHKNADLWSAESSEVAHRFAILSSRLSNKSRGLAPTVRIVTDWLEDENPEVRSAAALGLGHGKSPSAAGLLLRAYRLEADPMVRRAIVASLSLQRSISTERLRHLVALDPDPGSRTRAGIGRDLAPHFVVASSKGGKTKVTDPEGRISWVIPAPDGFIGWVAPAR